MLTGERIKITGQINKTGEIVFVSKYIVVVRTDGTNETFTLADFAAQDRYKFYIFTNIYYFSSFINLSCYFNSLPC